MRGRVSAVNWLFVGASNELGGYESGETAQWWGAVRAVVIGGIGSLVVTGAGRGALPRAETGGRAFDGVADAVEYPAEHRGTCGLSAGYRVERPVAGGRTKET